MGENGGKAINNAKSYKSKVKEDIENAQIEQHKEDSWEPNVPLDTKLKEDDVKKWDFLQKLAQ